MKSFRRLPAMVNAGSMADIAFLLLIFFLVTTTISADKGINRQLAPVCEGVDCTTVIADRNLLSIHLNRNHEIMIAGEIYELDEVKTKLVAFIDNNGVDRCSYCVGVGAKTSSDHPTKAVISLRYDALSTYDYVVALQDEITKAYLDLRTRYAENMYGKQPYQLTKAELKSVQEAYPFKVSEITVKRSE